MNGQTNDITPRERFTGLILGTAVGDALGLPAENLSPFRIRKWWHGQWKMRFLFGAGMVSDDTEHAVMVAQALLKHPRDPAAFERTLAWKLRLWFIGLPAGVGLATARACLKLWMGYPPRYAGVVSAGCGAAMRSAIIGAYFCREPGQRKAFVRASTRLTHRTWQAEIAALAVAECVSMVMTDHHHNAMDVCAALALLSEEQEWQDIMQQMRTNLQESRSLEEFISCLKLSRGVTGYSLHVVPVSIYAWLRHPHDYRLAMTQALDGGGDTDTVGAILGALSGATVGKKGIPLEWRKKVCEWPKSMKYMEILAEQVCESWNTGRSMATVFYWWPAGIFRNLLFLLVVLVHGMRRLAPPY